jgi:mono/diheme cytochrome c family protein
MMFRTALLAALATMTGAVAAQSAPASSPAAAAASAAGGELPYKVVEGYKVDPATMKGFRAWRAAACDRCHGANQEGLVGPSLVASLKTLSKEEFVKTVRDGRLEKGMQSFGTSPVVMENIDNLYAYLKGRADGAITRAKVEPMP